jgi:ubiquitin-protein ligase
MVHKRLDAEKRNLVRNCYAKSDRMYLFDETNIRRWIVIIRGPAHTCYEDGVF